MGGGTSFHQGDILIRSRQARSLLGQMTRQADLDYSPRSYLEVTFLDPQMAIKVQGSLVKNRPLARFLHKTSIEDGFVLNKSVQLFLGRSQHDFQQRNCGIFLYWHGQLIEAYKKVRSMNHNEEESYGIVGVIDVIKMMDDGSDHVLVHSNKQGFVDCEPYVRLVEWLSEKADEYLDNTINNVSPGKSGSQYMPDQEWVQWYNCRKWRMLNPDFDSSTLPQEWFCYMNPVNGKCEMPEETVKETFRAEMPEETLEVTLSPQIPEDMLEDTSKPSGVIVVSSQQMGHPHKEKLPKEKKQLKRKRKVPAATGQLRRGPKRNCKKN